MKLSLKLSGVHWDGFCGISTVNSTIKLLFWFKITLNCQIEENLLKKCLIIDDNLQITEYKSLQIIWSITINNKNSQKWLLCHDDNVDFSQKCGRPGGRGSENSDTCWQGGGKKGQKFADVFYHLWMVPKILFEPIYSVCSLPCGDHFSLSLVTDSKWKYYAWNMSTSLFAKLPHPLIIHLSHTIENPTMQHRCT